MTEISESLFYNDPKVNRQKLYIFIKLTQLKNHFNSVTRQLFNVFNTKHKNHLFYHSKIKSKTPK